MFRARPARNRRAYPALRIGPREDGRVDLGGSTRRVGKAVAAWILIALLLVLLGFLIHLAAGGRRTKMDSQAAPYPP